MWPAGSELRGTPEVTNSCGSGYGYLVDPWLGLDSLTFDTFGWSIESDNGWQRRWFAEWILLTETFMPKKPDLPSLDVDELQQHFASLVSNRVVDGKPRAISEPGRNPIIDFAVSSIGSTPLVRVLLALPVDGSRGHTFMGSILVPVAAC